MSTDEKMSQKQKIPIVHLKRFSLVKIFAHKIFTTQKLAKIFKNRCLLNFLQQKCQNCGVLFVRANNKKQIVFFFFLRMTKKKH